MARKRSTQRSNKSAKKQTTASRAGKPSATTKSDKSKQTTPEREPWTPWGKWLKRRRDRRIKKQREREERRQLRRSARRKRWARRRLITTRGLVFVGLLILACAIAGIVMLLLGRPYPWESIAQVKGVIELTNQINAQHERWKSLAVEHYEVEIEYTDQYETWCGPAVVEIRNGSIINPPSPEDTHWFPTERCTELFDNLIVDNSFLWLEDRVRNYQPIATYLEITFDESFGYPVSAQSDIYDSDAKIPDCCWRVTWRNLQPLYEE